MCLTHFRACTAAVYLMIDKTPPTVWSVEDGKEEANHAEGGAW